jgi:hypothetical protein
MSFAIRWNWNPGQKGPFVRDIRSNRQPYTENAAEAKRWKTRAAAERWLSLKDPGFASDCSIEEV